MTNSETTEPIDPKDKLCEQCGHNWDAHLLHGYGSPPTEGWMECPVEGCECKRTWGVSAEMKAQIEAEARALSSNTASTNLPIQIDELSRRKKMANWFYRFLGIN
jgi:hypothetical protein